MSTEKPTKINQLLQVLPKGGVATDKWLIKQGISNDLKLRYFKNKWLESLGHGACKRVGDKIDWQGAFWALVQNGIKLHVGGKTSLQLQGYTHFIRFKEKTYLFGSSKIPIPAWFKNQLKLLDIQVIKTDFLPDNFGIIQHNIEDFNLPISCNERAILEHLYLVGKGEGFEEASLIIEGLTTLRPNLIQQLLEGCKSIKVKRLFLFLASYHKHAWMNKINLNNITLGSGKRQIVPGGLLDSTYNITVPHGFLNDSTKEIF